MTFFAINQNRVNYASSPYNFRIHFLARVQGQTHAITVNYHFVRNSQRVVPLSARFTLAAFFVKRQRDASGLLEG